MLYPIKFTPIFKEKIWGGDKIKTYPSKNNDINNIGECWLLSGIEDDESIVSNGFLEGNTITEVIEIYMGELVGEQIYKEFGLGFPLLFKLIDSKQWLSVQVHPDDQYAKRQLSYFNGKSEAWYILNSDENSELISGFEKDTNANQFNNAIKNKEIEKLLHYEKTSKGDVFSIPPGRIHSLGPGLMVAEIQQSSDITFRVYDWDRTDKNGETRELHLKESMDVLDYKKPQSCRTEYARALNITNCILSQEEFSINYLNLDKEIKKDFFQLDSFVVYMGISGVTQIQYEDSTVELLAGELVLIPNSLNSFSLIPEAKSEVLEIYIEKMQKDFKLEF